MKVTVVTPLMRVANLEALEANIATVLKDHDWYWLIVLDRAAAPWTESLELLKDAPRITIRDYKGGSRWASGLARNYAVEVEDGFILNLDDDCLLHENMGRILSELPDHVQVACWQTISPEGAIMNVPTPEISNDADANGFGYRREILETFWWTTQENADTRLFNQIRGSGIPVAYFNRVGVRWNVNR